MVTAIKQDYPRGLGQFKEVMGQKYPGKNIDLAIKSCTATCWKMVKQNFMMNSSLPLYAAQAEALEQAIQAN